MYDRPFVCMLGMRVIPNDNRFRLCPDLLAVSVYNTKMVHFLSMACESIKWIEKSRKVFDKSLKKMVNAKFLRLNVNDDNNNGMGDVDIADQLRFCYRFDH